MEIEKVLVWRRHPGQYGSKSPMVEGRDYFIDELELHDVNPYGFRATINPTYAEKPDQPRGWVSPWHLGINQGPVVLMIENHRSGLLWSLMQECPYLIQGLKRAGFVGGWL